MKQQSRKPERDCLPTSIFQGLCYTTRSFNRSNQALYTEGRLSQTIGRPLEKPIGAKVQQIGGGDTKSRWRWPFLKCQCTWYLLQKAFLKIFGRVFLTHESHEIKVVATVKGSRNISTNFWKDFSFDQYNSVGFSGTPNNGTPYQYYSHTTPIFESKRHGSHGMGIVWEAYHQGVPWLGVHGITLE